ncbi:MAG TPA: ribose-phosphate pyrophosphokinase [Syntrophales bacterium]|nr:ribose-phosphate pyrophosphokinase [Syntrophales bacterium]
MLERMRIFSGNSNKKLAEDICTKLGIALGKANVATFSDGETRVEINENVRGMDVFIIQSTCPPVNDHVMELLILIDAMKRASADRVTAVIPYYGYARQDRKVAPRAPISAKLVADLITTAGASRVLSVDLHAGQIQGFFNIPVDNLFATPILLKYMMNNFANNLVVVSPDTGGVERARAFAKRLDATLAIIDKRREGPNESQVMNIIGNVKGKRVIILDDMIDTAGTMVQAAAALEAEGATEVIACCTHAVLSGPAIERIDSSNLKEIIITDTIPLHEQAKSCKKKITVLPVAGFLSEAVRRIYYNDSVSSLFI